MIQVRPSEARGHFDHGWLDTKHTFSFDQYRDPEHMGFRTLRVLNEDRVAPGAGFPMHFHRDMEIVTYVLEGALEHKDSTGGGGIIRPGDGQRMSAGRGIQHSEFNASQSQPVHLLQIWIFPEKKGIEPGYEQRTFSRDAMRGNLLPIAARREDGAARDGAVRLHTDATIYAAILDAGQEVVHALAPGRHAWLQVARGAVTLNGTRLKQGDGAAVSAEEELTLRGEEKNSEILLFDLP
jgi:redox-sensitive bicupin YhaK (pirin superfamily)